MKRWKRKELEESDITPFSRSDVHDTWKFEKVIVETVELRPESEEFGGREEIRGRGKRSWGGMCWDANQAMKRRWIQWHSWACQQRSIHCLLRGNPSMRQDIQCSRVSPRKPRFPGSLVLLCWELNPAGVAEVSSGSWKRGQNRDEEVTYGRQEELPTIWDQVLTCRQPFLLSPGFWRDHITYCPISWIGNLLRMQECCSFTPIDLSSRLPGRAILRHPSK